MSSAMQHTHDTSLKIGKMRVLTFCEADWEGDERIESVTSIIYFHVMILHFNQVGMKI